MKLLIKMVALKSTVSLCFFEPATNFVCVQMGQASSRAPWRHPPTGDFLDQPITCGPYYLIQEIGKGAFGIAYLAVLRRRIDSTLARVGDEKDDHDIALLPDTAASDLEDHKVPLAPSCRAMFLLAKANELFVVKRFRTELPAEEAHGLTREEQQARLMAKREMFVQERLRTAWVKGHLEAVGLRNDHLVRYFTDITDDETKAPAMVFEYCNCGDIRRLLSRCKKPGNSFQHLSRHQALQIFLQLAQGLSQLHEAQIVHGDLALRNCFVHSVDGESLVFNIGDFGLCVDVSSPGGVAASQTRGPHVPGDEPASFKSDVYTLGLLFYEILSLVDLSRGTLYDHKTTSMIAAVLQETKFDTDALSVYGEEKELIRAMISADAKERPTSLEVVRRLTALQVRRFGASKSVCPVMCAYFCVRIHFRANVDPGHSL